MLDNRFGLIYYRQLCPACLEDQRWFEDAEHFFCEVCWEILTLPPFDLRHVSLARGAAIVPPVGMDLEV